MQKSIGIYQSNICRMGGVETFIYNFCYSLREYYDITVVYIEGDRLQLINLASIVNVVNYNSQSRFDFDIVIRNSVWGIIPNKMFSKDNVYIEMRHADYKYLLDNNQLYKQYSKWDKINKVVACGDFVAARSKEVLKDDPTVIKNILLPKKEKSKILHFVTFSRLDAAKGWDRMLKLCSMLREFNIKFKWDIYTNDKKSHAFQEITFHDPIMDNSRFDYIAEADYCVLLSDSEGLPYTVQEALQYDTPCIVTEVGGCKELIQDGKNGYLVPLNMEFDVRKLLDIPKISNYDNGALDKWKDFLGNAEYKKCEPPCVGYLVEFTDKFEKIGLIDAQLNRIPKKGERAQVSFERANILTGNNKYKETFAKIIEKIYEE